MFASIGDVPESRAKSLDTRGSMKDLLSRIAGKEDDAAFRELFELYGPKLRGFMMRLGADQGTADELAQETLLTVWRKAALYSADKGAVATWIFTIARNLRIDRLRKEFAWQELSDQMKETLPSGEMPPDEMVAERQRQVRVRAVLADLTVEQREVVTLSYIEGLSHSEIAERLSLPLGTVKSRMRLAYQKVRTALEDIR